MIHPIYTELTECRDCYKCVRGCPVKAIQVKDGSAVVVKDRCIYCGHCVDICPSHAKKIRNDLARVRQFLTSGRKIYCSLAPSAASEFPDGMDALVLALHQLGFSGVSETALGAALVNEAIETYALEHDGACNKISTACPTVVQAIKKYYPSLVDHLSNIPSPLQCHSAYLRKLYGQEIGIVFIGPCIAKKVEADETPGYPDFSLTFEELRTWLDLEHFDLALLSAQIAADPTLVPAFVPCRAGKSTLYPVEGGMIASLAWGSDPFQTHAVAISGSTQVLGTLGGMQCGQEHNNFLELLFCEGGCINGPGAEKGRSSASKKALASRYTRSRIAAAGPVFGGDPAFVRLLLDKGYSLIEEPGKVETDLPVSSFVSKHSEDEIGRALKFLGKRDKAEELNCGGCGYNSCREMAIAYLDGMAEPEMCVTKMRKEAQSKIDVLLRTIPIGVVIVDDQLRIVDCNSSFLRLFSEVDFAIEGELLNLVGGLPLERFVPFHEKFRDQFANARVQQYRLHYQDKFLKVTFFSVEKQHLVGALFEDITTPTVRRETVIKKAEDVIQKSLETVQQIASLLGENAAETEIMLNSLIDAFKVPAANQSDGFTKEES
ncbi:MAG: [Fe-Fe] hydrogenase large subunit C-terminal domain-containing protein [Sphaerochaeta sp.]|uniref:[Fe-Fe] hydrogenase large subunit C-terminal domain-containing protein n=1 Tax=Sphaerochaeta sp. TaxID=1972642 RepID=UPI00297AB027|nr:[Fe-Fe] hydrogenase large subunit C-terminal domain-containing protein [uncultured Sphaerochaeta sp.]MDD3057122.1 [Fe-Fe] hydrogenase large subunit C-terminal domain-containing protein [Sphaerochaeta sp.]MDD3928982.1 [Fe-Fe] hydrogenase large subunit C-terminal domain-containing protein [Sphaerochaeta sp.]